MQDFTAPPDQALRDLVPENRLRVYDSRAALTGIADAGSLLELRSGDRVALGRLGAPLLFGCLRGGGACGEQGGQEQVAEGESQ